MTREVPGFKIDWKRDGLRKITLREMVGKALIQSGLKSHAKQKAKEGLQNEVPEQADSGHAVDHDHNHGSEHDHTHEDGNPNPDEVQVHHLAMVVVGEVFDVIRADTKMADTFLSQPKFVEFDPAVITVKVGHKYVDGEFVPNE